MLVAGSFVDLSRPRASGPGAVLRRPGAGADQAPHLARLRKGVEPVEQVAYARFLAEWQGLSSPSRGTDAVLAVVEQLSGYAPASAVESVVLPARVANYSTALLDELTAAG